MTYICRSAAKG